MIKAANIIRNKYPKASSDTHVWDVEEMLHQEGFIILTDVNPFKIVTRKSILKSGHTLLGDCTDNIPSINLETTLESMIALMSQQSTDILPVYSDNVFMGVVLKIDVLKYLYSVNVKFNNLLRHDKIKNQIKRTNGALPETQNDTDFDLDESEKRLNSICKPDHSSNYSLQPTEDLHFISQSIHNNIGQYLSALSLRCAELKEKAKLQTEIKLDEICGIHNLCITAEETLHNFAKSILHEHNANSSDRAIILSLCHNIKKLFNISVKSKLVNSFLPVNIQNREYVIRFIQEALINAAKHSKVCSVELKISTSGNQITYSISDKGCGFDVTSVTNGLGLKLLKFNAEKLGADFNIISNYKGTTIHLKLPVDQHFNLPEKNDRKKQIQNTCR